MEDLSSMTPVDLEAHLSRLREDLEEIEEERMFTLTQTGLHVSAKAVTKFETEIARLKEAIDQAERALRGAQAG